MKIGAIVYIVSENGPYDDLDMEEAIRSLHIKADRVEVVSTVSGHFDIMDAWWALTTKGMNRIVCMIAEVINRTELKLMGRELRLCG